MPVERKRLDVNILAVRHNQLDELKTLLGVSSTTKLVEEMILFYHASKCKEEKAPVVQKAPVPVNPPVPVPVIEQTKAPVHYPPPSYPPPTRITRSIADILAETEARGPNNPERPRRCDTCGALVKWIDEAGSCTNDTCKKYNADFFRD